MGSAESSVDAVRDAGTSAATTLTDSASTVVHGTRRAAEGNPLAMGLVAFGAGLVAATIFPATRAERDIAERAQPALEKAAVRGRSRGPTCRRRAQARRARGSRRTSRERKGRCLEREGASSRRRGRDQASRERFCRVLTTSRHRWGDRSNSRPTVDSASVCSQLGELCIAFGDGRLGLGEKVGGAELDELGAGFGCRRVPGGM